MQTSIRDRLTGIVDRMSPRTRQWATVCAISGAAVGILWAVFAMGSDDSARRTSAAAKRSEIKPTNVDLMAPGSQVRDVETWVGKAGRELELYKNDREEQRRINKEQQEAQEKLMRRFAEIEARLKAPPVEPPKPAPTPTPAPVSALPPATSSPARLPPDGALPRQAGLPPPPAARSGMPPGAPPLPGQQFGPPQPSLVRVAVAPTPKQDSDEEEAGQAPRTIETFLPVSFTRGILLGGLDAPTGGQSQSNPHPILIRLSDNSVLPNRFRAEYRECFVVGAGYGDISSERAYLRTESLSCVRSDGRALEVRIQGNVFGEDGKHGMRGRLVTKQGQMLANALLAGVVSGIGQGISTANTNFSTTALGTVATTTGSDAMKAGLGTGVGKALDRLAQYYIKLAEQTFPIIEIDAGREVDVVITKGVRIDDAQTAKASPTSLPDWAEPSERFTKVTNDEE